MRAFLILAFCALAHLLAAPPAAAQTIAIVEVSVAPMDRERVAQRQTVIVRDGVIERVGPSWRVRPPRGAEVVNGRGRWLIPGLADMHTHVDDPGDFQQLLSAGVTTTLNMGGASEAYRTTIRADLRGRRMVGPYPLVAMMIDGPGDDGGSAVVPGNPEEAREAVRDARDLGYDYIKIYTRLQPDIFEAVMDEARRQGLPVVGHVVRSVGLAQGLARGQVMIAHGEEYLTVFDGAPEEARIPELVQLSVAHGVYVTANVHGITLIAEQWGNRAAVDAYLDRPEAQQMREALRQEWRSASYARLRGSYDAEARFVRALVPALAEAGVPILAGTDTPDIPGVPPGASLVDEILDLNALGLSRYQSLATATRTAGAFVAQTLPGAQPFGQIRRGYRADLILLSDNPLAELETLRRPVAVMANGRWAAGQAQ